MILKGYLMVLKTVFIVFVRDIYLKAQISSVFVVKRSKFHKEVV